MKDRFIEMAQLALSRQDSRRRLVIPLRLATAVALLIAWQATAMAIDSRILVPEPLSVLQAAIGQVTSLTLPLAVLHSLLRMAAGLAVAGVIGISLGAMSALWHPVGEIVGPVFRIIYVVPTIAVLPVIILWAGIYEPARIVLIAYSCFYDLYLYSQLGVHDAIRLFEEPAVSMGCPPARLLIRVLIPGAVPFLSTGFRLAATQAMVGVVLAEFFTASHGASDGLGAFILLVGSRDDTADEFVGVITLGLFISVLLFALRIFEGHFSRWHVATRVGER